MSKSHRTPFLLHGLLWRYRSLTAKNFSNTPGKPVCMRYKLREIACLPFALGFLPLPAVRQLRQVQPDGVHPGVRTADVRGVRPPLDKVPPHMVQLAP